MSSQDCLTNLTDEELARIVGDSSEIVAPEVDKRVLRYIKKLGIEHGSSRIPNFVIYNHYCNEFEPTANKLSYIEFFRNFKKIFQQRRNYRTRYYMLNSGIYKLDGENINESKEFRKEQKEKSKKRS